MALIELHELIDVGSSTTSDSLLACQATIGSRLGAVKPADIVKNTTIDVIQDGTTHKKISAAEKASLVNHLSNILNPHSVTKTQVGLGNVDNTSDLDKPVSTATQAALDLKSNVDHTHEGAFEPADPNLQAHLVNTSNPHSVTAVQIGLGNVDNTSDLDKPVSTAQEVAIRAAMPVGSIIPWIPGYFTSGANDGYTAVLASTWAEINTILNPYGWFYCNGAYLNDPSSPIFNGAGRYLPNISDSRFLMGSGSITIGGSNTNGHTHTIGAHSHAMPHTHSVGAHSHTITHTHTIAHTHDVNIPSTLTSTYSSATGATTLTTTQIPAHYHSFYGWDRNANSSLGVDDSGSPLTRNTNNTGGGGSHTHSMTHQHSVDPNAVVSTGSSAASTGASSAASTGNSTAFNTGDVSTANTSNSAAFNSGSPSITENRPTFLSCFYIMKVK